MMTQPRHPDKPGELAHRFECDSLVLTSPAASLRSTPAHASDAFEVLRLEAERFAAVTAIPSRTAKDLAATIA